MAMQNKARQLKLMIRQNARRRRMMPMMMPMMPMMAMMSPMQMQPMQMQPMQMQPMQMQPQSQGSLIPGMGYWKKELSDDNPMWLKNELDF